jgi:hypothetical protein
MVVRSRRGSRPGSSRTGRRPQAWLLAVGALGGGTLACVGWRPFACVDDPQCVQAGVQGACEPTGWCSYADDDCPSGRRYGELAGMGFGSQCLDDSEIADDATDTDAATGDASTSEGTSEQSEHGEDDTSTGDEGCDPECVEPGTLLWMVVEDGPAGGSDALLNVAVDDADRIFVTGYVNVPGQGDDLVVREVASEDGATVWTETFDGGGDEKGWGIVVDSDDAVLIAGEGSGMPRRAYVGRYRDDGVLLWELEREGSGFEIDVDPANDVVVVGRIGSEAWLAKYDDEGEPIWELTQPGPAGNAVGWDLTVDAAGDVIAIGSEQTDEGGRCWVRKYTSDGTTQSWSVGLAGVGTGPNEGLGNAMAPDGDIVAVGNMSVGNDFHAWIAKYGPEGQLKWTRGYTAEGGGTANAHHVAVDGEGNIHVVGWQRASNETFDAWVGKYAPGGDELWSRTQAGDGGGHDRGYGIAVDSQGHAIVVGYLFTRDGQEDLWVAKYAP